MHCLYSVYYKITASTCFEHYLLIFRSCIQPIPGRERIVDVVPRKGSGFELRRGVRQAAHTRRIIVQVKRRVQPLFPYSSHFYAVLPSNSLHTQSCSVSQALHAGLARLQLGAALHTSLLLKHKPLYPITEI
jgi:hypothetical protein